MNWKNYFSELQRRHVVKAGIAYLVVAWLIIQILAILFPAFKASPNALKTAIIILGIGFPVWLVIAWVYDFSADGIKKTEAATYDAEVHKRKNIGLNRFIIGGLTIAVILLAMNTLRLSGKVDNLKEDYLAMNFTSSLAILPLEDISPNKDQHYFSDGLSRSIYDQLARFKDLKLVSTTSSFQYRERNVSIEVIAEELGVRYILDGSVQLFGDKFRVSINLIDTEDDTTIWSKTFDDRLEDVYDVYDEVSTRVGEYLKLTINVPDVRRRKVDPEAYELYLRAMDTSYYYNNEVAYNAMDSLIRKSISIDPSYALSYTVLSQSILHNGLYFGKYPRDISIRNGKKAAKKALELDSTIIGGLIWMSNWEWHDGNATASMEYLNKALRLYPNDSGLMEYGSHQSLRTNQIQKAFEFADKAIILNPKSRDGYMWKGSAESKLRLHDEAIKSFEMMMEHDVDDVDGLSSLILVYYNKGELGKALELLNQANTDEYSQMLFEAPILYDLGRVQESDSLIVEIERLAKESDFEFEFDLAWVHAARDEHDKAFDLLDKGYDDVRAYLEWLFSLPEFENLHDDPRWDAFLDRLGKDCNYDFRHKS